MNLPNIAYTDKWQEHKLLKSRYCDYNEPLELNDNMCKYSPGFTGLRRPRAKIINEPVYV